MTNQNIAELHRLLAEFHRKEADAHRRVADLRQKQAAGALKGPANVRARFEEELRDALPQFSDEQIATALDERMHHWYRWRARHAGRKPKRATA